MKREQENSAKEAIQAEPSKKIIKSAPRRIEISNKQSARLLGMIGKLCQIRRQWLRLQPEPPRWGKTGCKK